MTKIMACLERDLPPGTKINIDLMGRTVLLANDDGRFYAVDGLCPDEGANLADGKLSGHILRCPLHGSEFDVRTGELMKEPWKGLTRPLTLRSYPVSVEAGCVSVDIL